MYLVSNNRSERGLASCVCEVLSCETEVRDVARRQPTLAAESMWYLSRVLMAMVAMKKVGCGGGCWDLHNHDQEWSDMLACGRWSVGGGSVLVSRLVPSRRSSSRCGCSSWSLLLLSDSVFVSQAFSTWSHATIVPGTTERFSVRCTTSLRSLPTRLARCSFFWASRVAYAASLPRYRDRGAASTTEARPRSSVHCVSHIVNNRRGFVHDSSGASRDNTMRCSDADDHDGEVSPPQAAAYTLESIAAVHNDHRI